MATKDQYEFFRMMYEEEERRYQQLIDRGKSYITILTAYAGFMVLKVEQLNASAKLSNWSVRLGIGFLLAGFVFTILALGILNHEGICDPEEVGEKLLQESPADSDFFDYRIADFIVAATKNSRSNDYRAWCLTITVIAMALSISSYLYALM